MTDAITKFIDKLDRKLREQLKKKIRGFLDNPTENNDVKKLAGTTNTYRLRYRNIRIIFKYNSDNKAEIIDINFRGNIY